MNTTTLYEISANNLFKAGEIMMQDILKRLEQTRNELTQIIEQVPVHLFNHLEREGAWSIGQVCQHLVMTELLFIKG
nr:DinB family protein [Paenibacillus xylanexedens]